METNKPAHTDEEIRQAAEDALENTRSRSGDETIDPPVRGKHSQLINYLARRLARHQLLQNDIAAGRKACDNTLHFLREAIAVCGLAGREEAIVRWFCGRGMSCDCTVLRYLARYWADLKDDAVLSDVFFALDIWPNDKAFAPTGIDDPDEYTLTLLAENLAQK